jgi:hypothetical protein
MSYGIKLAAFVSFFAVVSLVGCAHSSKEIQTQYVSPMQYRDYNCNQIAAEMDRISHRAQELAGQIDKKASNDKVAMGVGMVLFWPALFFLKGDGPEAQEYGRLKGEYETLQRAAIKKECDIKTNTMPVAARTDASHKAETSEPD